MSTQGEGRRPMTVEALEDGYRLELPPAPLTEDELRWLGLVLIPAVLPPIKVAGVRPDR